MRICDTDYRLIDVYDQSITVPDSYVVKENKTGKGHGEAKLYMGSKDAMRKFYANSPHADGFVARCFVLKKDLLSLLRTIKHEYQHPSIMYHGMEGKKNMMHLWKKRIKDTESLADMIEFEIRDQKQIKGPRGYVNSTKRNCIGYDLIRNMALPFVSYISVMKLEKEDGEVLFYWRPFADFTQMASLQYAARNYGKGKQTENPRKRKNQIKYREELYNEFKHCPFTHIDEFKILIASHIKPHAVSTQKEQADPNNGLMLSPLYDKLFDKGFISFTNNGELLISDWLSAQNQRRISFDYSPQDLYLNEKRKEYLKYHRENVFK